jgi:hypothetical protein
MDDVKFGIDFGTTNTWKVQEENGMEERRKFAQARFGEIF